MVQVNKRQKKRVNKTSGTEDKYIWHVLELAWDLLIAIWIAWWITEIQTVWTVYVNVLIEIMLI